MNQIRMKPSTIAQRFGVVMFLLAIANIGVQISRFVFGHASLKGLVPLFNLDAEQNIPTYFTVLLMIFTAIILTVIATLNQKQRLPHVLEWRIISFIFLFMAYDEAFQVHEQLVSPFRKLLGGNNFGILYFAWVIPALALVLVLGIFFLKFLLHLSRNTRLRFLISAIIYLGGAIGVELIEGYYAELYGYQNLMYILLASIEESLEMLGLIFFIWSLLKYCADNYKEVRFRLED